ncbi:hypothetical protein EYF80_057664 [Liparis tanakae]|uniref:Uncharacterized protein n=1 Tax=Liparis tanakae TaxID=230148 RepID=A0A4Z2ETE5_9TELE|nr:hypothetical protein EYF80_057664 [Liparis tanakae]
MKEYTRLTAVSPYYFNIDKPTIPAVRDGGKRKNMWGKSGRIMRGRWKNKTGEERRNKKRSEMCDKKRRNKKVCMWGLEKGQEKETERKGEEEEGLAKWWVAEAGGSRPMPSGGWVWGGMTQSAAAFLSV